MMHPTWTAGAQTAVFSFFGLMFYEQQAVSPFVVTSLTGYRLPDPGDAHKRDMPAWSGAFQTRAYDKNDFSPKEWDSPDRQKAIDNAKAFASAVPDGTLPPPPAMPPPPAPTSSH
jgi:hypothetical protein